MKRIAAGCAMLIFGCLPLIGTAEAGWVVHSKTTGPGGEDGWTKIHFQRNRVRAEFEGGAQVMNFPKRIIIMENSKEGKYSVMTFEEYRKMISDSMGASRQMMEEMKRRGISIPGMSSPPRGEVTVSRISGATIAGYPSDGYRVSVGGTPQEDIWVAKKIDLMEEIEPARWKEFAGLSQEMKEMVPGSSGYRESPAYRKIVENGYPMRIVDKKSGSVQEVTRVEKKEIAGSFFEEPKDLARVPFGSMMGGPARKMPSPGELPSGFPAGGMPGMGR